MYRRTHVLIAIVAHAHSDWVQISQQHYIKKPAKLQDIVPEHTHIPSSDSIYPNSSLTDRFNKGVIQRVPAKGSIKLVNIGSSSVKSPFGNTDPNKSPSVTESELKRLYDPIKVLNEVKPDFVTKNYKFNIEDKTLFNDEKYSVTHKPNIEVDIDKKNGEVEKNFDESSKADAKVKTMENLLKFLNVVATTISRNTRRSVRSKVNYLEDLKNTLLVNIEGRIESLWPEESPGRARAARAAREHVQFPSSESALMTISFLTFAVFLIKLVLQVIQTYKTKTMMVAPTVFATVGRKKERNRT